VTQGLAIELPLFSGAENVVVAVAVVAGAVVSVAVVVVVVAVVVFGFVIAAAVWGVQLHSLTLVVKLISGRRGVWGCSRLSSSARMQYGRTNGNQTNNTL